MSRKRSSHLRLFVWSTVLAWACGGTYHPAPPPAWEQQASVEAEVSDEGGQAASVESSPVDAGEGTPAAADPYEGREPVSVREGRASYYHDSLAGNHTANGEVYQLDKLTAASRDLPFGTLVRVVRLDTGASVVVRINDRGPFGDHRRILDLSRAAAEALDMLSAGVVRIRAEILQVPE
jgi:rare lipoprotein A